MSHYFDCQSQCIQIPGSPALKFPNKSESIACSYSVPDDLSKGIDQDIVDGTERRTSSPACVSAQNVEFSENQITSNYCYLISSNFNENSRCKVDNLHVPLGKSNRFPGHIEHNQTGSDTSACIDFIEESSMLYDALINNHDHIAKKLIYRHQNLFGLNINVINDLSSINSFTSYRDSRKSSSNNSREHSFHKLLGNSFEQAREPMKVNLESDAQVNTEILMITLLRNALHITIINDSRECCKELLIAGADPSLTGIYLGNKIISAYSPSIIFFILFSPIVKQIFQNNNQEIQRVTTIIIPDIERFFQAQQQKSSPNTSQTKELKSTKKSFPKSKKNSLKNTLKIENNFINYSIINFNIELLKQFNLNNLTLSLSDLFKRINSQTITDKIKSIQILTCSLLDSSLNYESRQFFVPALFLAIYKCNLSILKLMVNESVPQCQQSRDILGNSAIHIVCICKSLEMNNCLFNGQDNYDIILRFLICNGFSINKNNRLNLKPDDIYPDIWKDFDRILKNILTFEDVRFSSNRSSNLFSGKKSPVINVTGSNNGVNNNNNNNNISNQSFASNSGNIVSANNNNGNTSSNNKSQSKNSKSSKQNKVNKSSSNTSSKSKINKDANKSDSQSISMEMERTSSTSSNKVMIFKENNTCQNPNINDRRQSNFSRKLSFKERPQKSKDFNFRMKYEDVESALKTMTILARNPESLTQIVDNIDHFIGNVISVANQSNEEELQVLIYQFYNQLIKTLSMKLRECSNNISEQQPHQHQPAHCCCCCSNNNLNTTPASTGAPNGNQSNQLHHSTPQHSPHMPQWSLQMTAKASQILQVHFYMCQLTHLMDSAFDLLKHKQFIHFTALVVINRILDLSFTNSVYEYINIELKHNHYALQQQLVQGGGKFNNQSGGVSSFELISSGKPSHSLSLSQMPSSSTHNRRQSVVNVLNNIRQTGTKIIGSFESGSLKVKYASGADKSTQQTGSPNLGNNDEEGLINSSNNLNSLNGNSQNLNAEYHGVSADQRHMYRQILIDRLSTIDPGTIVSILHNRITIQRRTFGYRVRCSPSTRMRSCASHCIQILSARLLAVMSQSAPIQRRLLSDGHFKTLVDALDPNHDPHLLCLLLQCLATISLDPYYHEALLQTMIEDNLLHLILPSDEWYYTNYSTKYAPYVKYHATRLLVYLGRFHCLAGRFDLFNNAVFDSIHGTGNFLTDNVEDVFIHNMALGKHFIYRGDMALIGCSIESLIRLLLEDRSTKIDYVRQPDQFSNLLSFLGSDEINFRCLLTDRLRDALLMVLPAIIHPLIIIRLINHRIFGRSYKKKIRQISNKTDSQDNCALPSIVPKNPPKNQSINGDNCMTNCTTPSELKEPTKSKSLVEDIMILNPHSNPSSNFRRPSFVYCETMKAEASGHRVICPWEGKINKEIDYSKFPHKKAIKRQNTVEENNENQKSQECTNDSNDKFASISTILDKNNRLFAKFRSSIKRKSKPLEQQHHQSSTNSNDINVDEDCDEKELLDFQRELVNLPKFSLDPSNVDSRSASPSLLLSRSNSLPNVTIDNYGNPNSAIDHFYEKISEKFNSMEIIKDFSNVPEIRVSENIETVERISSQTDVRFHIGDGRVSIASTLTNSSDSFCNYASDYERIYINKNTFSKHSIRSLPVRGLVDNFRQNESKIGNGKTDNLKTTEKTCAVNSERPKSLIHIRGMSPIDNFSRKYQDRKCVVSPNLSLGNNSSIYDVNSGELMMEINQTVLGNNNSSGPSNTLNGGGAGDFGYYSNTGEIDFFNDCNGNYSMGGLLLHRSTDGEKPIKENGVLSGSNANLSCEIPELQVSAMQLIDYWLQISVLDFCLIRDDIKEFLTRLSSQGRDQRLWCQNIWSYLKTQMNFSKKTKPDGIENYESTSIEYKRLKQLVTSGDLPCTKDDAATLAAVHLHIDCSWPDIDNPSAQPRAGTVTTGTNIVPSSVGMSSSALPTNQIISRSPLGHPRTGCSTSTSGTRPVTSTSSAASVGTVTNPTRVVHQTSSTSHLSSNRSGHFSNTAAPNPNPLAFLTQKMAHSRLTSSRMRARKPFKFVQQISCVSDKETDRQNRELKRLLAKYIPPEYHESKKTHELIKEKYKKLWHTPFYESEIKLKQLYIKLCKNLPAYGCRLFQVREILRGNIRQNVQRILGVGTANLILLDNKSKVLIRSQAVQDFKNWHMSQHPQPPSIFELEFRASKPWQLSCITDSNVRCLMSSLWELLDVEMGAAHFSYGANSSVGGGGGVIVGSLANSANPPGTIGGSRFSGKLGLSFRQTSLEFDLQNRQISLRPDLENGMVYAAELEDLANLIHFPEEVALLLAEVETKLFQQIQPQSYVRHVSLDLNKLPHNNDKSVWNMITRLKEVSSWIIHLIITQPSHEERKHIFTCILRLALFSYGIGNFNAVVEILTGLKSEKLRPFWLTINDSCKTELQIVELLSEELLSLEPTQYYRASVARAMKIKNCNVIPFFGLFLSQLKNIVNKTPNIIILTTNDSSGINCISDFNGEDRFTSRIGVGGLINMNKVKEVLSILNDVSMFCRHNQETRSIDCEMNSIRSNIDFDNRSNNSIHLDPFFMEFFSSHYNPIIKLYCRRPSLDPYCTIFNNSTGAICTSNLCCCHQNTKEGRQNFVSPSIFIIQPSIADIDSFCLQIMHLGSTVIRHDKDWTKCSTVFLKLALTNSLLMWTKTASRISQFIPSTTKSPGNSKSSSPGNSTINLNPHSNAKGASNRLFHFSDDGDIYSPFRSLLHLRYSSVSSGLYLTDSSAVTNTNITSSSGVGNVGASGLGNSGNLPGNTPGSLPSSAGGVGGIDGSGTASSQVLLQEPNSGYLDLFCVKHIFTNGGRNLPNLLGIMRKLNYRDAELPLPDHCCISLVYGSCSSENKLLHFFIPSSIAKYWLVGLTKLLKQVRSQRYLPSRVYIPTESDNTKETIFVSSLEQRYQGLRRDNKLIWLKHEYLRLFYSKPDSGMGLTLAETTRIFGGRRWSISNVGPSAGSGASGMGSVDYVGGSSPLVMMAGISSGSSVAGSNYGASSLTNTKQKRTSKVKKTDQIQLLNFLHKNKTSGHEQSQSISIPQTSTINNTLSSSPSTSSTSKECNQTTLSVSPTKSNSPPNPQQPIMDSNLLMMTTPSYLRHNTFYSYQANHSRARAQSVDYNKLYHQFPHQKTSNKYDYLEHPSHSRYNPHHYHLTHTTTTTTNSNLNNSDIPYDISKKASLNFLDFVFLFRAFMIYSRQDLKMLFDQVSVTITGSQDLQSPPPDSHKHQQQQQQQYSTSSRDNLDHQRSFLLTRSYPSCNKYTSKQRQVCAAVAVSSIINNCASYEKSHKRLLTMGELATFLCRYQGEFSSTITEADLAIICERENKGSTGPFTPTSDLEKLCCNIIERHEIDPDLRSKGLLSFEGFSCYLMDENNYLSGVIDSEETRSLDHPLSHYFIASSHNTYLNGHQITGESSVEMYSQVLLSGCRCIELDCWDGEDGIPVIYHGHTFTNKISFQSVVETIDRCAFETSPYPVILSIENHCSLTQQQRMAQIFKQIFGEKLVTNYLFESDFEDDPYLPSPEQLKYRILIKNKKILYKYIGGLIEKTKPFNIRNSSVGMTTIDSGLASEDIANIDDDDEYDDDEDDDATTTTNMTSNTLGTSSDKSTNKITSNKPIKSQTLSTSTNQVKERSNSLVLLDNRDQAVSDWQFEQGSNQSAALNPSLSKFILPAQQHSPQMPTQITTPNPPNQSLATNKQSILNSISSSSTQTFALMNQRGKPIKTSQIDSHLSDLVVYTQAVKLRSVNLKNTNNTTNNNNNNNSSFLSNNNSSFLSNNNSSTSPQNNPKSKKNAIRHHNQQQQRSSQLILNHHQHNLSSSSFIFPSTSSSSGLNLKIDTPCLSAFQSSSIHSINPGYSTNNSAAYILHRRQQGWNPSSHKIVSINEGKAKSICRRIPIILISHCEKHLIRSYPAGIRLDSSNFNPVIFWAFGIQMVALNYQTEDQAMELNNALFRQSGHCGYVLKPNVMWDKTHPMFGRFNPWDKEFDQIKPLQLTIQIISGSNLNLSNPNGNPSVELEMIGIQQDCVKYKTHTVQKNMVNPQWFENFSFEVLFPELAFLRFIVFDNNSGHVIGHNVFPVTTLKRGFRHVSLKAQNLSTYQPMNIASLFLYTELSNDNSQMTSSNISMDTESSNQFICDFRYFQQSHNLQHQLQTLRQTMQPIPNQATIATNVNHSMASNQNNASSDMTKAELTTSSLTSATTNLSVATGFGAVTTIGALSGSVAMGNAPLATAESLITKSVGNIIASSVSSVAMRRKPWKGHESRDGSTKRVKSRPLYISLGGLQSICSSGGGGGSSSSLGGPTSGGAIDVEYIKLKITDQYTALDVICHALHKAGINYSNQSNCDYVLLQETVPDSDCGVGTLVNEIPRVVPMMDNIAAICLAAADASNYRFIIRRNNNDPTSRAWMTTIFNEQNRRLTQEINKVSSAKDSTDINPVFDQSNQLTNECAGSSGSAGTTSRFLVCIYDVSPDQPYTILKTQIDSTVNQIIAQALLKARRKNADPDQFVLVEEIAGSCYQESPGGTSRRKTNNRKSSRRILSGNECLYSIQRQSNAFGKFILMERKDAEEFLTESLSKRKGWNFLSRAYKNILQNEESTKTQASIKDVTDEELNIMTCSTQEIEHSPICGSPMSPKTDKTGSRYRTYSCPNKSHHRVSLPKQVSFPTTNPRFARFLWSRAVASSTTSPCSSQKQQHRFQHSPTSAPASHKSISEQIQKISKFFH